MRQNFLTQFIQLLNLFLCKMQLGVVQNWAHSADQCWLQVLQFLVHLTNLLCILLRCNSFLGIQKTVVDQASCRSPDCDHDLILMQGWLWEVLWSFFSVQALSWSSPVVVYSPLFVTHHDPIEKWFIAVL